MKKTLILSFMILLITVVSFPQGKQVKITAERAKIYLESSTSSYLIETLSKGTILNIYGTGDKPGEWYNVFYMSRKFKGMITGFVKASLVEPLIETPVVLEKETESPPKKAKTPPLPEKKTQLVQPKPKETAKAPEAPRIEKKLAEKKATEITPKTPEPTKLKTPTQPTQIPPPYSPPKPKKIFLKFSYNAGFSEDSTPTSWSQEIYYENASYNISNNFAKGNAFIAGLGYKFSSTIGLELGVHISSRNINSDFNVSIPHPLLFNSPRTAENTGSYKLTENAAYLNFVLSIPFSKLGLDLYGGPAYFFTTAQLINQINVSDTYPYQTVNISAATETIKKNVFGFNAGASLNFYFANSFGIFLNAQYFSGSADFDLSSDIPGLKVSLGGLKAGGGLRILF